MKANVHTHTDFCDGKDSPAEMARAAAAKGFTTLGFSAHCAYPFSSDWHIHIEDIPRYRAAIKALQAEYAGKMKIFCGFEADYIEGALHPDRTVLAAFAPDFIIGSVHYVPSDKKTPSPLLTVDDTAEKVAQWLSVCFDDDGARAVKAYFKAVRSMVRESDFDVVGHADLVKKRNKTLSFFDEKAGWYKTEIKKTAEAIARTGKIVEINTGGIARGATDETYPSAEMLYHLRKNGAEITINSDAHTADTLDTAFDTAIQTAAEAGYTSFLCLEAPGPGGWKKRRLCELGG